MRSLISFSAAILLTLASLPGAGGIAGQSRKNKKKARSSSSRTTGQATTKSQASSVPAQAAAGAAVVPPATAATLEPQSDGARRITPVAAREAIDKGQAIVVDVRSEESYNAGHVKGARWINLNEIEARIKELPRDKMIITYCS